LNQTSFKVCGIGGAVHGVRIHRLTQGEVAADTASEISRETTAAPMADSDIDPFADLDEGDIEMEANKLEDAD